MSPLRRTQRAKLKKGGRARLRSNRPQRRATRRRPQQQGGRAPRIALVIARYREDLDWMREYADLPFQRIFLYNKGPATEAPTCPPLKGECIVRQLENVGMCDHTYMYHIIENYDDLADITIFMPASGDLPNKKARSDFVIKKTFAEGHPVMTGFVHPNPVHKHMYDFTLNSWAVSHKDNKPEGYLPTLHPADVRPFGKWYEAFLPGVETPLEQNVGIFSVSRELIRAKPREFYQTFLDQLAKDKQPEVAHYMERAWPGILGFPREWFYDVNELKLI